MLLTSKEGRGVFFFDNFILAKPNPLTIFGPVWGIDHLFKQLNTFLRFPSQNIYVHKCKDGVVIGVGQGSHGIVGETSET